MSEPMHQQILDELKSIKENMATKTELANLGKELRAEMFELRTELRSETSELRSEMSKLRTETADLRLGMSELRSEVSEIRSEVAELPFIKQALIELKEAVGRIEAGQERHGRIIELLCYRSIDQESALRRMRV